LKNFSIHFKKERKGLFLGIKSVSLKNSLEQIFSRFFVDSKVSFSGRIYWTESLNYYWNKAKIQNLNFEEAGVNLIY